MPPSDASNDGFYAARNISRPGPVVVRFHHCQGDPIEFAAEWYQNKWIGIQCRSPIPVPGSSGHFEVNDIHGVLGAGGNIAGTVTRESNGNSSVAPWYAYQAGAVVASDTTDSDGDYQISDLPTGTPYQVRFSASGFVVEWYNRKKTTQSSANDVSLTNGATKNDINATMQVPGDDGDGDGGGVRGRRRRRRLDRRHYFPNHTGSAVSGAEVEVYKTSGNSAGSLVESDTTSSSGTYKVDHWSRRRDLPGPLRQRVEFVLPGLVRGRPAIPRGRRHQGDGQRRRDREGTAASSRSSRTSEGRRSTTTSSGCVLPGYIGCTETQFCPVSSVTRGQMAAFLVRGPRLEGDTSGDTFSDDNGSTFEHEIEILAEQDHPGVRRRAVLPLTIR